MHVAPSATPLDTRQSVYSAVVVVKKPQTRPVAQPVSLLPSTGSHETEHSLIALELKLSTQRGTLPGSATVPLIAAGWLQSPSLEQYWRQIGGVPSLAHCRPAPQSSPT